MMPAGFRIIIVLALSHLFRGYGLFIGLEVVKDKTSKEPDGKTCVNIVSGYAPCVV